MCGAVSGKQKDSATESTHLQRCATSYNIQSHKTVSAVLRTTLSNYKILICNELYYYAYGTGNGGKTKKDCKN